MDQKTHQSHNVKGSSSSDSSLNSTRSKSGVTPREPRKFRYNSKKLTDVEREIRCLLVERRYLLKNMSFTEEELKKTSAKLQRTIQEKTSLGSNIASLKKELKELKKSNDVLKTKVTTLETTGFRRKDLQIDLANARGCLVSKDHDIAELQAQVNELQKTIEKNMKKINKQDVEIESLQIKLNEEIKNTAKVKYRDIFLPGLEEELRDENDVNSEGKSHYEDDVFDNETFIDPNSLELKTVISDNHVEIDKSQLPLLNDLRSELHGVNEDQGFNTHEESNDIAEKISVLQSHNTDLEKKCESNTEIISSLKNQNEILTQQLSQANTIIDETNIRCSMLKEELNEMIDIKDSLKEEIESLSSICEELEKNIEVLEEEKRKERSLHQEELNKANLIIDEQQTSINTIMTQNNTLRDNITKHEVLNRNQKNDLLTMEHIIDELNEKLMLGMKNANEKELKIVHYQKEIKIFQKQLNEIKEDKNIKTNELKKVQDALENSEQEKSDLLNSLKEKNFALEKLENSLKEIQSEFLEKDEEIKTLEKTLKDIETDYCQTIEYQERTMSITIQELKETITEITAEKEGQIETIADLQRSANILKKQLNDKITLLENANAELNDEKDKCMSRLQENETKIMKLIDMNKELRESVDKENALVVEYEDKIEILNKTITQLNNLLKNKTDECKHYEKMKMDIETELELKEKKIKELSKKFEEMSKALTNLKSKVESYEHDIKVLEKHVKDKEEILSATYSKLRDTEDEVLEKHNIIERYSCKLLEMETHRIEQDKYLAESTNQISSLQTALHEKEMEINKFSEEKHEVEMQLHAHQEAVENFQSNICYLEQQLKESESKYWNVCNEMDKKTYQNQQLVHELEIAKKKKNDLAEQIENLERSLTEIYACHPKAQLEELMAAASEQVKLIASLQAENADIKKSKQILENELDRFKAQGEWHENRERSMLSEMLKLENRISEKKKEAMRWKELFEELQIKVEPFKEQLDMYATEKRALLSQNLEAFNEAYKASQQYALLLGHQNHKQKIHHVLKLKEDNLKTKQENGKLREQVLYLQRKVERLQNDFRTPEAGRRRFDPSKAFQHNKENDYPLRRRSENLS